jgi:hypothetical protein
LFCDCFLYSSELLCRRDIRHPALTRGEDLVFLAHALTEADKICVVPEAAYTYRIRDPRPPASFDGVRDYFAHAEMVKHIYGRRFRACWEAYEPYVKDDLAMLAEGAALDEHESRWAAGRLRRFSSDCRVPSLSVVEHDVDVGERASQPALSVVIPCRNAEQHLGHQLDDQVAPGFLAAMYEALDEHEFVTSPQDAVSLNPAWSQRAHWVPPSTVGLEKFINPSQRVGSAHPVQPDTVPQAFGCPIGVARPSAVWEDVRRSTTTSATWRCLSSSTSPGWRLPICPAR